MGHFPIFVEMAGRRCVVIGGGAVAERKAQGLLEAGAAVTIISPELTPALESRAARREISHVARHYRAGDLQGYELAFAATDNRETNAAIFRESGERGVWVNAADDPAHCDFILPSLLRRGDLFVAVSTGGASPALSRIIREELERYLTEDYALLAEVAAQVRGELKRLAKNPSASQWHGALDAHLRRLVREGDAEGAKSYLLRALGVAP